MMQQEELFELYVQLWKWNNPGKTMGDEEREKLREAARKNDALGASKSGIMLNWMGAQHLPG